MARKRYTVEQIIRYLRQADMLQSQGQTVIELCRGFGMSEQTYCRRRKEYGGLKVAKARRSKELEQENARLERAVADLTLVELILEGEAGPRPKAA